MAISQEAPAFMRYDIIGDIHGYSQALESILSRLGYSESGGVYGQSGHQAVFVGDFVDRGPKIRETLGIVRRMVASGTALSVMGNHELNSICFSRERRDEPHRWLRSRTDRHLYQHLETLYQFRDHRSEWSDYLDWFYSLPLFLDLGPIRIVHAAWYEPSLDVLGKYVGPGNTITEEFLFPATRRGTDEFDAIQNVLKGVELDLPGGDNFIDKDGNERKEMRIRWWIDAAGKSYRDLAISSRGMIQDVTVAASDAKGLSGYRDSIPVFFGHYWLEESVPAILSPYIACLDYSVAKGGYLAAYRWQGETQLVDEHFVVNE